MLEKYASMLQNDAAKSTAQVTNARKVLEVVANLCEEMSGIEASTAGREALLNAAAAMRQLTRMIL